MGLFMTREQKDLRKIGKSKNQSIILRYACCAKSPKVRLAAVEKLNDVGALNEQLVAEKDPMVLTAIVRRYEDQMALAKMLFTIPKTEAFSEVAKTIQSRLTDTEALKYMALHYNGEFLDECLERLEKCPDYMDDTDFQNALERRIDRENRKKNTSTLLILMKHWSDQERIARCLCDSSLTINLQSAREIKERLTKEDVLKYMVLHYNGEIAEECLDRLGVDCLKEDDFRKQVLSAAWNGVILKAIPYMRDWERYELFVQEGRQFGETLKNELLQSIQGQERWEMAVMQCNDIKPYEDAIFSRGRTRIIIHALKNGCDVNKANDADAIETVANQTLDTDFAKACAGRLKEIGAEDAAKRVLNRLETMMEI